MIKRSYYETNVVNNVKKEQRRYQTKICSMMAMISQLLYFDLKAQYYVLYTHECEQSILVLLY